MHISKSYSNAELHQKNEAILLLTQSNLSQEFPFFSAYCNHLPTCTSLTVILFIDLYVCETWSLTLRENVRARRNVFLPRKEELTGC